MCAACSFSHDSKYMSIAGEQAVLDVENVDFVVCWCPVLHDAVQ